jgi:hypothetical protein
LLLLRLRLLRIPLLLLRLAILLLLRLLRIPLRLLRLAVLLLRLPILLLLLRLLRVALLLLGVALLRLLRVALLRLRRELRHLRLLAGLLGVRISGRVAISGRLIHALTPDVARLALGRCAPLRKMRSPRSASMQALRSVLVLWCLEGHHAHPRYRKAKTLSPQ